MYASEALSVLKAAMVSEPQPGPPTVCFSGSLFVCLFPHSLFPIIKFIFLACQVILVCKPDIEYETL